MEFLKIKHINYLDVSKNTFPFSMKVTAKITVNCSCALLYYFYPLLAFVAKEKKKLKIWLNSIDLYIRKKWTGFILLGLGITGLTSPLLGLE